MQQRQMRGISVRVSLLLLTICLARSDGKKYHRLASGSTDFDYWMLALQWSPSDCKVSKYAAKCELPSTAAHQWQIHGLWPSSYSGGFNKNSYCKYHSKNAIKKAIEKYRQKLLKFWADTIRGNKDESFWTHEWKKHGTCASSMKLFDTPEEYFEETIALATSKFNLRKVFDKSGVTPNKTYSKSDFDKALKSIGFDGKSSHIIIECKTIDRKCYVKEIRLCLSKNGFKPVKCARSHSYRFRKPVVYPSWPKKIQNRSTKEDLL